MSEIITYLVGYYILSTFEIKGKEYYRYHDVWTYSTNNYWAFQNVIQDGINKEYRSFLES